MCSSFIEAVESVVVESVADVEMLIVVGYYVQ